jgi:hypothetical protein
LHRQDCRRVLPAGDPIEYVQFGPPWAPFPETEKDTMTTPKQGRTVVDLITDLSDTPTGIEFQSGCSTYDERVQVFSEGDYLAGTLTWGWQCFACLEEKAGFGSATTAGGGRDLHAARCSTSLRPNTQSGDRL